MSNKDFHFGDPEIFNRIQESIAGFAAGLPRGGEETEHSQIHSPYHMDPEAPQEAYLSRLSAESRGNDGIIQKTMFDNPSGETLPPSKHESIFQQFKAPSDEAAVSDIDDLALPISEKEKPGYSPSPSLYPSPELQPSKPQSFYYQAPLPRDHSSKESSSSSWSSRPPSLTGFIEQDQYPGSVLRQFYEACPRGHREATTHPGDFHLRREFAEKFSMIHEEHLEPLLRNYETRPKQERHQIIAALALEVLESFFFSKGVSHEESRPIPIPKKFPLVPSISSDGVDQLEEEKATEGICDQLFYLNSDFHEKGQFKIGDVTYSFTPGMYFASVEAFQISLEKSREKCKEGTPMEDVLKDFSKEVENGRLGAQLHLSLKKQWRFLQSK